MMGWIEYKIFNLRFNLGARATYIFPLCLGSQRRKLFKTVANVIVCLFVCFFPIYVCVNASLTSVGLVYTGISSHRLKG